VACRIVHTLSDKVWCLVVPDQLAFISACQRQLKTLQMVFCCRQKRDSAMMIPLRYEPFDSWGHAIPPCIWCCLRQPTAPPRPSILRIIWSRRACTPSVASRNDHGGNARSISSADGHPKRWRKSLEVGRLGLPTFAVISIHGSARAVSMRPMFRTIATLPLRRASCLERLPASPRRRAARQHHQR